MKDPLSVKQMIQSMQVVDMEMIEGTVIKTNPLEIAVTNDDKLVLDDDVLVIPEHLTDHKVRMTIPTSGSHSQYAGSGLHGHENVEVTVYNALKKGDKVHILSFDRRKQYYVLDRVVE